MRWLVVAWIAGVAASSSAAAQPTTTVDPEATEAAQRFVSAIERRDDGEIGESLHAPVKLARLRFDDPSCQRQFGGKRVAKKSQLARLATCLPVMTGIANLRVVNRGAPLFLESDEVTLRVGYRGRFDIVDLKAEYDGDIESTVKITPGIGPPPIVSSTVFERLRISGARRIVPSAHARAAIAAARKSWVTAGVRYCVGTDGRVATVTITRASGVAAYDLDVARSMRVWRFKPHLVAGKPTFACANDIQTHRIAPLSPPTP